ncbi:MAG: PD-(D/E)XK nuclease family transposase, partial [Bacteroidota bacterium]
MNQKREYVDPKVDIAFKKIFGDEKRKHILISLLNAVMDKGIVEVDIVNPYQIPKLPELKYTILDIRAKDA